MNKSKVVLLYGKPASGKLTIAKELQKKCLDNAINVYLLDNHFFNDIIFPFVEITDNMGELCNSIYQIRDIFLNSVAKHRKKETAVYIFTNVLLNSDDDLHSIEELKIFTNNINADFIPVHCNISMENLLDRCSNEDRKSKAKLTDKDTMKSFCEDSNKFLQIKDSIELDSDNCSAKDNAEKIFNFFLNF